MSPRHRGRRHGGGMGGQNGTQAVAEGQDPSQSEGRTDVVAQAQPDVGQPRGERRPRPERPAQSAPAAEPGPAGNRAQADTDSGCEVVDGEPKPACTLAQMRRFIKSRPYVPVHELRRRFEIAGIEDEVSAMLTGEGTLFVGLPAVEAGYLCELVKSGDVGYEVLHDPTGPAVVGVFPMKPVARQ